MKEKQKEKIEGKEQEKKVEEKTEKKPKKETEIQKLKDQIKELTELLQRTQASFENYRKQQEKRILEIQNYAHKDLIIQLLPLLDNFELALKNTNTNQKDFLKGTKLIYSQLFTLLENQGLRPIPTENQTFDPHLHEALLKTPSEKPENTILEELQKGFLLNDQVIRHAKVKVSSGPKLEKKEEEEKTKESKQNEEQKDQNKINMEEIKNDK